MNSHTDDKVYTKTNWLLENEQLADDLKESRLFKGLSEMFFTELLSRSEVVHFSQNNVILREGQFNQYLYFLLQGKIEISAGGESILDFSRVGDIFGEVCITTEPVFFYSVIAKSQVLLLRLSVQDISNNSSNEKDIFFREDCTTITNRALIEKLKIFVQLAKQLQVATRQLGDTRKVLKHLKTETKQNEFKALAVLEALPELVIYLDRDGKILKIKPSIHEKLAFDHQKYVGENIADIQNVPSDLKELAINSLIDAMESQENKTLVFQLPDDPDSTNFEARIIIINKQEIAIMIRAI
ncbi:MAG: cyclic nucleotide-binding domain-containing protein [Deltaproteobacteria bacterium]|nr:cyclic nucleotide-binding domain-containing protein [Deltaproteobacteria bacterium]